MATILGGSGADALAGTPGVDLILGFDPDGPTNQVATIEAMRVAAGLSQPVFATAPPDDPDRLVVVERAGRIQTLDLRTGTVAPTPFLDLSGQVATAGEQGLLGLAFHPALRGQWPLLRLSLQPRRRQRDTRVPRRRRRPEPRRPGERAADPAHRPAGRLREPQGRLDRLRPGRDALRRHGRRRRRRRSLRQRAEPERAARQDPAPRRRGADAFPADPARNYAIPPDNPFAAGGGGAPENLGLWAAQSLARLLRPRDRHDVDRRCRPGPVRGDRPRRRGRELRLEPARGFRALRGGAPRPQG